MRMYDLILKKRGGGSLTKAEIAFFVRGVTEGSIPEEQTAALLMAVFFRGMTTEETVALTLAMARSGQMIDLSGIEGVKADKHSTGGVGDKTTLIVAPIVAACGVKVAKMSGKGLGHTGGTVDKLASIPGFQTELPMAEFIRIVNDCGLCVIGQSGNLAPADKKLYALRDVTGTVDSLPLIAASIMSKKLAAGADCILLDVKAGSGAFMKTTNEAIALAKAMVDIGEGAGRDTMALITSMDRPLGYAIGNAPEVIEAAETLKGQGPSDLYAISITLASCMLKQAGRGSIEECKAQAAKAVSSGAAFKKLQEMTAAQGGDPQALSDYSLLPRAAFSQTVTAPAAGFIQKMETTQWGTASVMLGAGRETKDALVDYGAGILLRKKVGDYVQKGEELAVLFTNKKAVLPDARQMVLNALVIGDEQPENEPLIYASVERSGTQVY